jgi:hypothetical protein
VGILLSTTPTYFGERLFYWNIKIQLYWNCHLYNILKNVASAPKAATTAGNFHACENKSMSNNFPWAQVHIGLLPMKLVGVDYRKKLFIKNRVNIYFQKHPQNSNSNNQIMTGFASVREKLTSNSTTAQSLNKVRNTFHRHFGPLGSRLSLRSQ